LDFDVVTEPPKIRYKTAIPVNTMFSTRMQKLLIFYIISVRVS